MSQARFSVIETFCFTPMKGSREEIFYIISMRREQTIVSRRALSDITAKPNSLLVFPLSKSKSLQFLDGKIKITYLLSTNDIAKILDSKGMPIRFVFRRSVDNRNIIRKVPLNIFFVEFFRSRMDGMEDFLPFGIWFFVVFVIEFNRRFSKADYKPRKDLIKPFLFPRK